MNNTLFGKVVQNFHIKPLCIFLRRLYLKFKRLLLVQPNEKVSPEFSASPVQVIYLLYLKICPFNSLAD